MDWHLLAGRVEILSRNTFEIDGFSGDSQNQPGEQNGVCQASWLKSGVASDELRSHSSTAVPRTGLTESGQATPLSYTVQTKFLLEVFSGLSKLLYWAGAVVWLCLFAFFWQWWISGDHIIGYAAYFVVTAVLLWVTLLPAYFICIFGRAKVPAPARIDGRIAMVVTKVPSEPFSVVKKTLEAMLDQTGYRFDTWLADEDPSVETSSWCHVHNVRISTRKGAAEYHQPVWPRRARCKEGNLAYFYDHYGYADYDFVAQLDADHVPSSTYLEEILAPFANPSVGYVSAPSICDSNAGESWSARGRLYAEASMHGALQAGYNNGLAPLCIGSHYAVRTRALREIGGLGPELAEDHSTTLMMNAGGWQGVHAINAIAHGEGPKTFADLATQEFQWSRSVVSILLRYSPSLVPKLSLGKRFQFLFSELWYPLFSAFMLISFALPVYVLATGDRMVNVAYPDFLMHIAPLSIWLIVLAFCWRSTGTFRPMNAKVLSMDSTVFIFARWPWALLGSLAALRDRFSPKFVDFRITPKGATSATMLPYRVIAPYVVLSAVSGMAAWLAPAPEQVWGFYMFAAFNSAIYAVVLVWIVGKHIIECGAPWKLLPNARFAIATSLALLVLPVVATYDHGLKGLHSLTYGAQSLKITTIAFPAAGAGTGRAGMKIVRFSPRWFSIVRSVALESTASGSSA